MNTVHKGMEMKKVMAWMVVFSCVFCHGSPALDSIDAKVNALCQGNQSLKKLSSDLLQLRLAIENNQSPLEAMKRYTPHALRNEEVRCIIGADQLSSSLVEACTSEDLTILGLYSFFNLHHIVVSSYDPHQFDSLVQRADVRGIISEPVSLPSSGSVFNEADRTLRSYQLREVFGIDGSDVRIGVLSDSLNGNTKKKGRVKDQFLFGIPSQMKLELPRAIRVLDLGDGTGNDEATAMCELIHDIAPGADLSFAAVLYSYSAYAENIRKLWTDPGWECDILVDDISFLGEPMYQNGPIAQAAMEAVEHGIPYFAASGNYGNNGHERPFTDSNEEEDSSFPPQGKDFHDFGAAYGLASDTHLKIHLPFLSTVFLALHWDEPYGGVLAQGSGSESDLDLYLVSDESLPLSEGADGNILSSGTNFQGEFDNPMGEPYEVIVYTNLVEDRDAYIVINHVQGTVPSQLHLFVAIDGNDSRNVIDKHLLQDRTLIGHMVAPSITSIAAIPFREIDHNGEYVEPLEQFNVQPFSALGGELPLFFDASGQVRWKQPQLIFKPDLTGPDDTSTSVPGFEIFTGTSAAAANLAAVAALLLDADPSLSPAAIHHILSSSAIDLEKEGPDFLSGAGFVDAFRAIQSILDSHVSSWSSYR